MAHRIYFSSDELQMSARVLDCTPDENGQFRIILDATLFHPQGGGQPSDAGTIGEANVLRVVQDGDEIVHFADRPVEAGEVVIEVVAEARSLHARLHSAGHLLGYAGEQNGWQAVKGHHWPGEARVVFAAQGNAQALDAAALEQLVNGLTSRSLARRVTEQDGMRMVTFGDLPAYSCGGTHVASTSDIGEIKILKIKEKKGQVSVHYALGQ